MTWCRLQSQGRPIPTLPCRVKGCPLVQSTWPGHSLRSLDQLWRSRPSFSESALVLLDLGPPHGGASAIRVIPQNKRSQAVAAHMTGGSQ